MSDINIYSIGSKMLICCLKGNLEYCQYLYDNGYQKDISRPNINLRTPLTVSCSMGHLHISKWLYQKGAHVDIDKKDKNGAYPAYCAIREGHLDTVRWLYTINKLNNIWQLDSCLRSPIWHVCNYSNVDIHKRLEIAKFLVIRNIDTRNTETIYKRECCFDIWQVNNCSEFEKLLLAWCHQEINYFFNIYLIISRLYANNYCYLDPHVKKVIVSYIHEVYIDKRIRNLFKLIANHKKVV